jgi:hypothetical protein
MFAAIVNTPGYLPDREPVEFDSTGEAWSYLADERSQQLEAFDQSTNSDQAYRHLLTAASQRSGVGTVYGTTPGYAGSHDLGVAYSVELVAS